MSNDQLPDGSPGKLPVSRSSRRRRKERTEFYGNKVARSGVRWIILPVLILIAIGIVGASIARPIYNWFKARRGASLAVQAEAEFRKGQVISGAVKLRSALIMAAHEPAVMRVAARMLGSEDSADAVTQWQLLVASGAATRQDRLEYVALALRLKRNALAREQLELLLKDTPRDPLLLRGLVQANLMDGQPAPAISAARILVEADPANWKSLGLLGEALLASSQTAELNEGKAILLSLASTNALAQPGATFALANSGRMTTSQARQVVELLGKKPVRLPIDSFVYHVLQAQLEPATAAALLPGLVQEISSASLADRLTTADWLMKHGAPDAANSLIQPAESRTNLAARIFRLEMAARRQDWESVRLALANTNSPLPGITHFCFAGWLLATNASGISQANVHFHGILQRAVSANAADSDLLYLAYIAETAGVKDAAIAAHEFRMRRPWSAVAASAEILRLTQGSSVLTRRLPALKLRAEQVIDDEAAAAEYYYLAAVLGRDLAATRAGLELLGERHPNQPEIIVGLALVALRSNNRDQAAAIMEEKPIDPATLSPRVKAAYIYVMGELGQHDVARRLAREVDLAQLYPEEQALVQPSLNR